MSRSGFRCTLPLTVLVCALAAIVTGRAVEPAEEVRGLWVVRHSLTSPPAVARLVADARRTGFTTLVVQVRGRGDAYFASSLEPRATALAAQPESFDPLAEVIRAGHAAGLKVHAWVNVDLVASATDLPASKLHIVNRHPEWLMVPRALASELNAIAPSSPGYVGKLARWTRAQSDQVEGLFASPLNPAAASHVVDVVTDLTKRYAVDGIHLDYIRFPGPEFDHSRAALAEFRTSVLPDVTTAERDRLDARLAVDPFIWVDMYPRRWAAFRQSRVTALVMRIRTTVKALRPSVVLSAAVVADADTAQTSRFQDWPAWAANGIVDVLCPMAYTTDAAVFDRQVREISRVVWPTPVWAGIGAYRLTPADTVENIRAARRAGAAGVLLFSYDGVRSATPAGPDYLDEVSRAAFTEVATAGSSR